MARERSTYNYFNSPSINHKLLIGRSNENDSLISTFFLLLLCLSFSDAPVPKNFFLSIAHSCFVKGDQTNFEIEPSFGVEASELYPEIKYTTVDEFLNQFI